MKKESYSKPHFSKKMQIHTLQAQRVLDRIFKRLVTHLYSIEAIIPFTHEHPHARALEKELNKILDKNLMLIFEDKQSVAAQVVDLKIDQEIEYSHVKIFEAKITSPSITKLVNYIKLLDITVIQLDLLWLTKAVSNQKRKKFLKALEAQSLAMMREIDDLVSGKKDLSTVDEPACPVPLHFMEGL